MQVDVTQEDRDAAEALWADHGPWKLGTLLDVTQSFARHREAARIEGIRLGLEKAAKALDLVIIMNGEDNPDWLDGVDHARTAIRAIDPAVIGEQQCK